MSDRQRGPVDDGIPEPRQSLYRRIHRDNPWWIPPYLLGRVPGVEANLVRMLGFVALALLFENYDFSLFNAALKFIAADLSIDESGLPFFSAVIRLGALPAFLVIPMTDYFGRRRVFLVALIGLSFGNFCTAFSASEAQFILFQVLSRTFMLTASVVAIVIVSEEFPADHRGWGIGMLAAIGAVGHGLGALMFAFIEYLPYGWRALYWVGLTPVFILGLFIRAIPETRRFRMQEEKRHSLPELVRHWFLPGFRMMRYFPARSCAVVTMGTMASFGHNTVFLFIGYFVLTYHGWEPWQYSAMVILCGALGIPGNVAAGYLGDRLSRRIVGGVLLGIFPLLAWLFYTGPALILPVVWVLMVFALMGGNVIIRAMSAELFPTEMRGTSAGLMGLMETVGAGAGLLILGGAAEPGNLIGLIPVISLSTIVAAFALILVPETSRQELEMISALEESAPRRLSDSDS